MPNEPLGALLQKQKKDLMSKVLEQLQETHTNESFVERILSNISDLLLILSADFEILQASAELYHVLGYRPESSNLTLLNLLDAETMTIVRKLLPEGEFRDLEALLIGADGLQIPVTMRGSLFTTPSGRILYLLHASDRRDVSVVLEQMREVQSQLIHSDRLASLGEMAAGIGHELTQPLNTILLLARASLKALDLEPPEKAIIRRNLQDIIQRVNYSSAILRSLKGFASKAREELRPVRLNVILLDILGFLELQLEIAGIEVALDLGEESVWVLGQEVQLEQVFLNIIHNCMQSMAETAQPRMSIRLFRHRGVDHTSLQPQTYIAAAITDNGPGIVRENLEKVFDPFFTTKEVGTGMGLGLSIVDRIVRSHHGHVRVESTPHVATTFTVLLPELGAG